MIRSFYDSLNKHVHVTILLLTISVQVYAQKIDSVMVTGGITGDTNYIITENRREKFRFLGNSWYTAVSYNLSRSHELSVNVGRTYGRSFCGGGGCYFSMKSWGLGYNLNLSGQTGHLLSAFTEFSAFPIPPGTIRVDYLYDITNNSHYLRPSIGLSLFALDILYNYSFILGPEENKFRHGVTFRVKYFPGNKKWEKKYPSHC